VTASDSESIQRKYIFKIQRKYIYYHRQRAAEEADAAGRRAAQEVVDDRKRGTERLRGREGRGKERPTTGTASDSDSLERARYGPPAESVADSSWRWSAEVGETEL
jgi:hypothetical protein